MFELVHLGVRRCQCYMHGKDNNTTLLPNNVPLSVDRPSANPQTPPLPACAAASPLTLILVALALDTEHGYNGNQDDHGRGGQCHHEPRGAVERLPVPGEHTGHTRVTHRTHRSQIGHTGHAGHSGHTQVTEVTYRSQRSHRSHRSHRGHAGHIQAT